jgi:hypothetical protein
VNLSIYLILSAALGPRVLSASNKNEYQKKKKIMLFLGSKLRPVLRANKFAAICEPIV